MLILDTDHLAEYQKGTSPDAHRLKQRLDEASQPFAITIITVEEVMRGWMAAIRRTKDPFRQISPYAKRN
jgi:predicted nucleic acid-binding protein